MNNNNATVSSALTGDLNEPVLLSYLPSYCDKAKSRVTCLRLSLCLPIYFLFLILSRSGIGELPVTTPGPGDMVTDWSQQFMGLRRSQYVTRTPETPSGPKPQHSMRAVGTVQNMSSFFSLILLNFIDQNLWVIEIFFELLMDLVFIINKVLLRTKKLFPMYCMNAVL